MIKRVVSFGCSLIYGDELPDWDPGNAKGYPRDKPSKFVWPQLIADHFGVPHVNKGFSGASNEFIFRHLIRYLFYTPLPDYEWKFNSYPNFLEPFQENDLVIIQWTSSVRNEIFNSERAFRAGMNYDSYAQLLPALRDFDGAEKKLYETLLTIESHEAATERFLTKLLISHNLLSNKTNFIQCIGIGEPTYGIEFKQTRELLKTPNLYPMPFMDYANQHNFPVGKGWHPLEDAHLGFSKLIINHMYDNGFI